MFSTPPNLSTRAARNAQTPGHDDQIDHQELVQNLIRRKQSYLLPDYEESEVEAALGISVDSQTTLFEDSDWASNDDDNSANIVKESKPRNTDGAKRIAIKIGCLDRRDERQAKTMTAKFQE